MRTLYSIYHFLMAFFGDVLCGFPSRKLFVIGVTGTKGKSTAVELVSAILETDGKRTALLSTIREKIGSESRRNTWGNTMPGRFAVQRFLRKAVSVGCTHAIVEVTSQGVVQHRHQFINWDAAMFLNIAPEHIESHGSFENYRDAKVEFFRSLAHSRKPVKYFFINEEDINHHYFERAASSILGAKVVFFNRERFYEEVGRNITNAWFVPDFNMENAAAATAVARVLGVGDSVILRALQSFRGVPGRLEYVQDGPFAVVVDYAHTPDSLEKVYEAVNPSRGSRAKRKLICVLGAAGGGRDKWKRPAMGKIAGKYCDAVVLTNEDPYDEYPGEILDQIEEGIRGMSPLRAKKILRVLDRREAVKSAIGLAKKGDTVILTGKGSEAWLHVERGRKLPWNERRTVEEILGT